MHRAGHWLGMDVHDAGLYQLRGESVEKVIKESCISEFMPFTCF